MQTMTYKFDELPLVVAPNIDAALVNGAAEIEYSNDGEWSLGGIYVEGYKRLSLRERADGAEPWILLPASEPLANIIAGRLNAEWRQRVQYAVNEKIDADYEEMAS